MLPLFEDVLRVCYVFNYIFVSRVCVSVHYVASAKRVEMKVKFFNCLYVLVCVCGGAMVEHQPLHNFATR